MNETGLNSAQHEAVTTIDGPLLLLAGAGTGKTRVITARTAHMLSSAGIPAKNILALTFTNKAAREMRERITASVSPETARPLTIGTFHAFCSNLLRSHIRLLGYAPNFSLATQAYQIGVIKSIIGECGYASSQDGNKPFVPDAGAVRDRISKAKTALKTPEDMRTTAEEVHEERVADVYQRYQERLKTMNVLDFDDLLVLVLRLWEENPDILNKHRNKFRYIMVDEYQDTNHVQFQLIAKLAEEHRNLCVVGDDDQAIYSWRGAVVENILHFDQYFPDAKTIRLEENYRSTQHILNAANSLISNNSSRKAKKLRTQNKEGEPVQIVAAKNEKEEADIVAKLIKEKIHAHKANYNDFGVLYRSNFQARNIEAALQSEDVPYHVVGSRSFFERKEIVDAISILQTVYNPADEENLLRIINVPPRGFGTKAIESLQETARITGRKMQSLLADPEFLQKLPSQTAEQSRLFASCLQKGRKALQNPGQSLSGTVHNILEETGYLDGLGKIYKPQKDALNRRENVFEFIDAAADYEKRASQQASMQGFLENITLRDTKDRVEDHSAGEQQGVTLLTVHAAKGLEFPYVFITGLEQNMFPNRRAINTDGIAEERRLFYVALTRAQKEATITRADYRTLRGKKQKLRPSYFLYELPEENLVFSNAEDALAPASQETAQDILDQMKDIAQKS